MTLRQVLGPFYDKSQHFLIGYAIAHLCFVATGSIAASFLVTLAFAWLKERQDQQEYGGFDLTDLLATIAGVPLALWIAL